MHLDDLLAAWRQWKERPASWRLREPCVVEHEYHGKPVGHPSTFAFVRFECRPADALTFKMTAFVPEAAKGERYLPMGMAAAILDVLLAQEPARPGVALHCTDIGWDDVTSSGRSFYLATAEAMRQLRGKVWDPPPPAATPFKQF